MKSRCLRSYILSSMILLSIPAHSDFSFDPNPIREKVKYLIDFSQKLDSKNEKIIQGATVRGDARTSSKYYNIQNRRRDFNCMGNGTLNNRLQATISKSCQISDIENYANNLHAIVRDIKPEIDTVQTELQKINSSLQSHSFTLNKAKHDLHTFDSHRQRLEKAGKSLMASSTPVKQSVDNLFESTSCQQAYDEVFEHHITTLMAYGCSPVVIDYWVNDFVTFMSSTAPRRPLGQLNKAQSIFVEARTVGIKLIHLLSQLEQTIQSLHEIIEANDSKVHNQVPGVS